MKSQKIKKKRFQLSKYSIIFLISAFIFFPIFYELHAIPYASAFSTGLKPGDVIVDEFIDMNSYYDSNMTLLDFYIDQKKMTTNITDIRYLNENIEIHLVYRDLIMEKDEIGVVIINSSLPLGTAYIPQEYIGFNFSDSAFLDYINFYFEHRIMEDDRPEGNFTWNHEILAKGLGFRINANYTNYKFNCTKEYNLTVSLYYSRSGVLLRRIEELRIKLPPNYNYSIDNTVLIVSNKNTFINSTLSNFDGKDERPWDPNYTYPSVISENENIPGYNIGIFIGFVCTASLFIIRKRKHKYYND
ncbi:MAG: hypothetical protein K9W44_14730 [Candidatus Lokiarchaeota archaeon]|nr:hypothetical protein [Candidatus Harpocratesius repetitus]